MRKFILILLVSLSFTACKVDKDSEYSVKNRETPPLELRQLVQRTETSKQSSGYYFLVAGGYSSTETENIQVKVFAKVNGDYRMISIPIEDIRIRIDNSIKTPNLKLNYYDEYYTVNQLLDRYHYIIESYTITCPEQYLPEKLLPINL